MAKFSVSQSHQLPLPEAKARVEALFEAYKSRFGISSRWEGNTLKLSGSGFDGTARLGETRIDVDVNLGMAASLFKSQVESGIKDELQKRFKA